MCLCVCTCALNSTIGGCVAEEPVPSGLHDVLERGQGVLSSRRRIQTSMHVLSFCLVSHLSLKDLCDIQLLLKFHCCLLVVLSIFHKALIVKDCWGEGTRFFLWSLSRPTPRG